MNYNLLNSDSLPLKESALFCEGVLLALNMACKPVPSTQWITALVSDVTTEVEQQVIDQLQAQYNLLMANRYACLALVDRADRDSIADIAEGFMTVWPMVEDSWESFPLTDGTQRMLQALLTTWMLAIDEAQTQRQMHDAGIDNPPALADFIDNIDLMISEVAAAADTNMLGSRWQMINPHKTVGRNDPCPCGSGQKFKYCCGA